MKEKLYTIPLNDAVDAGGECPLCNVEKLLEQDTMDFVLGSCASYMEPDVRELTDKKGFCREHMHKMFTYGNTLGNAWILKTRYMKLRADFEKISRDYKPAKMGLADRFKGKKAINPITDWTDSLNETCYICDHMAEIRKRYVDTFFVLWKKDDSFKNKILNSKGFCISHFGEICKAADEQLSAKELEDFYSALIPLMQKNLDRMQEDVNWLIEKYDYENQDADWKNSKDANQRGMQKIMGGFPADQPYRMKK